MVINSSELYDGFLILTEVVTIAKSVISDMELDCFKVHVG